MDRRTFLGTSLATAAATAIPPAEASDLTEEAPSSEYCYYIRPYTSFKGLRMEPSDMGASLDVRLEVVLRPKQARIPEYSNKANPEIQVVTQEPECDYKDPPQLPSGMSWDFFAPYRADLNEVPIAEVERCLKAQGVPAATLFAYTTTLFGDERLENPTVLKQWNPTYPRVLPPSGSIVAAWAYLRENFQSWVHHAAVAHFQVLFYDGGITLDQVTAI